MTTLPFAQPEFLKQQFGKDQGSYQFGKYEVALYGCVTLAEMMWMDRRQAAIKAKGEDEAQVLLDFSKMILASRCPTIREEFEQEAGESIVGEASEQKLLEYIEGILLQCPLQAIKDLFDAYSTDGGLKEDANVKPGKQAKKSTGPKSTGS